MEGAEVRTYIPEKKQAGKRHWIGKKDQQQAVYANRLRVSRTYGKSLLRKRGELIERSFAGSGASSSRPRDRLSSAL
jgi:transposase